MDWLYKNVILGALGFLIEMVPWWAWIIVGAAAIGFFWKRAKGFWKLFGWQGVLMIAIAIVTLGAYRQGWLDHKTATLSGVPKDDPLFDLSPKKARPVKKRRTTIFDVFKRKG